MKKIIYSIMSLCLALSLASCQPEVQMPEKSANPITSVTAKVFYKGEYLEFTGYPEEGSNIIEIQFPWFWPIDTDNLMPMSVLTEAKVTAELANNVVITEPITVMDLTQFNTITVIDQVKESHEYIITGRIAKLNLCDLQEFVLSEDLGYVSMVKDQSSQISILTDGNVGKGFAKAVVSPHATISPDPAKEEINFDDPDLKFTVTAHDGKTKRVYSIVKEIPPKRPFGLRPESGKVIFEKQIYADLKVDVADLTTGLAVSGTNLILNTKGKNPVVMDRYTGEPKGSMSIDDLSSVSANYYMTSDDDGNIIFCNFQPADNIFKVWVSKDINTAPVELLSWNTEGAMYGKKMSVSGSLDKNAVISVPLIAGSADSFARWTVTDGKLVDQTPDVIQISGIPAWTWNCDICYSGDTPDSDYFVHSYSGMRLAWVSGSSNSVKAMLDETSVNFVSNTVDVISFNRGLYLATTQANGYGWGGSDLAWLMDITTVDTFVGTIDADYNPDKKSEKPESVIWQSPFNTYGARAIASQQGASYLKDANGNTHADVILAPSTENDYYMYMYFMFCNGYVVGVQLDCLDM